MDAGGHDSSAFTQEGGRADGLTGVSTDGTGEMGVDGTGEPVMSKRLARDAPRAKVFGGEHAARGHDAHQGVESWFVGILCTAACRE